MPEVIHGLNAAPRHPVGRIGEEPALGQLYHCGPGEETYPPRLEFLQEEAPLWIRSALSEADIVATLWNAPAVAIVGTRSASAVGRDLTREIAWGLSRAGVVIVSGLALGIDAAAHEGALMAGGATVAVLGCGLNLCYPIEHTSLAGDIVKRGALVSEWPPQTTPLPWRFPRRNRLISGLADAVLLVEGGPRSGAIHTVRFAADQGRDVMVVPRDPGQEGSVAPNRLLREGVAAITSAQDVLAILHGSDARGKTPHTAGASDEVASAAGPGLPSRRRPAVGNARGTFLHNPGKRILETIARNHDLTTELLLLKLPGVTSAVLMAELMRLEIEGRAYQDSRGRWRELMP